MLGHPAENLRDLLHCSGGTCSDVTGSDVARSAPAFLQSFRRFFDSVPLNFLHFWIREVKRNTLIPDFYGWVDVCDFYGRFSSDHAVTVETLTALVRRGIARLPFLAGSFFHGLCDGVRGGRGALSPRELY